jgi:hypothetical protein
MVSHFVWRWVYDQYAHLARRILDPDDVAAIPDEDIYAVEMCMLHAQMRLDANLKAVRADQRRRRTAAKKAAAEKAAADAAESSAALREERLMEKVAEAQEKLRVKTEKAAERIREAAEKDRARVAAKKRKPDE